MRRTLTILLIGAAGLAIWLATAGWCVIAPGEVAVVRRLGRAIDPPWGPGLHWRFPAGIDRVDRIRTDAVRRLTIGYAGPAVADREPSAGEVMTGDLNLLRVEAALQYRVADPVSHALRGDRAEELLALRRGGRPGAGDGPPRGSTPFSARTVGRSRRRSATSFKGSPTGSGWAC